MSTKKKLLALLGIGNALLHNRLRMGQSVRGVRQVLAGDAEFAEETQRKLDLIRDKQDPDHWKHFLPVRALLYSLAKGNKYAKGTLPPQKDWNFGSRQVRRHALRQIAFSKISNDPRNVMESRRRRRVAARMLSIMMYQRGQAAWQENAGS